MFLFQNKAILRHFKNVTHVDSPLLTPILTPLRFYFLTLTRPGNACPVSGFFNEII